jgi:type IV pilus modification protein PilV
MLGIAGLYLTSLQAGRSANLRMQAVNLTTDLADHIRANRKGRDSYQITSGAAGTAHTCSAANCTPKDIAENDLYNWKLAITAALPANANGQVTFTDNAKPAPDRFTILITWREAGSDIDSTYSMTLEQDSDS